MNAVVYRGARSVTVKEVPARTSKGRATRSLSTLWQYNSVEDVASLNARLRYNVRDGTDLWIVYNEALNT